MSSNKMLQIDLLILYLLTILSEVFASPIKTDSNSTYDLERRECKYNPRTDHYDICDFKLPTLAQIVARLHDTNNYGKVTPERSAVFYTNLDDPKLKSGENVQLAWLHGWLKKENVRYYWYADSLDPVWYFDQVKWIKSHEQEFWPDWRGREANHFEECRYQALAVAALNPDVYFFTKKGAHWKETSFWEMIEYPYLTSNTNVQRIWRVDPRPPDVKGVTPEQNCILEKKELLWERGRDKEIKTPWTCAAG